jgi:DNA-binding SARP family transcriptional activator
LGWGKPLALLALLTVRRELGRDEVVDLLWRGVAEDKARNAFRQALHRLRAAVGDEVLPQDRERLKLVPGDHLVIDLDRFEAAARAGRYAEALDACRGEFLEESSLSEPPFDMWAEHERTRLRARLAQVLTDATSQASTEGNWTEAVARTQRLMAIAPFESSAAQLAATTLISAGRRVEARELLKQFASTLDSELGMPMPPELQSMLNRLERHSEKTAATSRSAGASSAGDAAFPFVGRESELSQLVTLCRTTAEESGGFALVKGDTGIGKSRLLRELSSNIKSLGRVTVLSGREHVAGIQLPYAVFAEALRPLVRASGVVGASRHLLAEAARLLPDLRDELELPAVTDVEDEAGRLRFFEGIAALVDAAAFERPIVLIIDDAHLMGPSTVELLSYLCARLARSAVTFVIALKQSETPVGMLSRLEAIAGPDSQTHPGRSLLIQLGAIPSAVIHEALHRPSQPISLDASTRDALIARADGVPARLIDLLRRVARGEPLPVLAVSFGEVLGERVSRLTSVQRRLLFVIALIGRPTPRPVVGAAAHLPAVAVDDALAALAAERLIEIRDDGLVEMGEEVERVAIELAGPSTRAFLSGWIADELSARSAPSGELARFYAASGQAKPAFEQSRSAAFQALAVGAVPEAVHHLQVARSFALSPADRSAIESHLTAIGAGHRQIVTPRVTTSPVDATSARGSAAPTTPGSANAPAGRLETLFPNWRMLLGAAVGTLLVTSIVLADRARAPGALAAAALADTLLVAQDDAQRELRVVTGDMSRGFTASQRLAAAPSVPAWIDSVSRPWANPRTSPSGRHVAIERVTAAGSDLFVVSADRRDTTSLAVGNEDAHAFGWSPDGRWLLATTGGSEAPFDRQLVAFRVAGGRFERRIVDPTVARSVVEAAWSPDGSRIAWVSRVGAERQLEVFVANADGRNVRNVSRAPADDQHIAWSPDGQLLAFTSVRDGNAELYALSFPENRLWRLTSDAAQDDAARFSTNGRLIAFESTRGGAAAVYVMPALGGDARRVEAARPISVVKWIGRPARYIDRVLIEQPQRVRRGDTSTFRLVALDQFDEAIVAGDVEWTVLDSLVARRLPGEDESLRIVARNDGIARVAASVGGWRFDTAIVALGNSRITLLRSAGNPALSWQALGAPRPAFSSTGIALLSDREWDSGILSRDVVPLVPGLAMQAVLDLPLADLGDPLANSSVALVAPEDTSTIDADAPQFLRYASLRWNAESGRIFYAVGREVFSEAASVVVQNGSRFSIELRIEDDSTVSFRVAGRERWRSSLRILEARQSARAQVWISTRATGNRARLTNVSLRIDPTLSNSP